jgi:tryptophan synthase alpha chain
VTVARIEARFAALAAAGRAGFVPYIVAGDPDPETCWRMLEGLPGAGADLIELGLPFSDPMADGPAIQKGAQRALAAGMTTAGVLALANRFRHGDAETPLILMGYYNPILAMGLERFADSAAQAGVDGLIVVDLPPEEAAPLAGALAGHDLALIRLATPTTDAYRLATVAHGTAGFVYLVSVAGVTGGKEADAALIKTRIEAVRAAAGLPVAVGFGIRTPQRAAEIAAMAEAVVVGSALVEAVAESLALNRDPGAKVLASVGAMAQAVRSSRAGGSPWP